MFSIWVQMVAIENNGVVFATTSTAFFFFERNDHRLFLFSVFLCGAMTRCHLDNHLFTLNGNHDRRARRGQS